MYAGGTARANVIDGNIAVTWLVVLLAAPGSLSPVMLSADIQPSAPKIGGVVALRVTATWPAGVVGVVPRLERWHGPFELVGFEVDEHPGTTLRRRTWLIRFRSFEAGHLIIPGVPFEYQLEGTSEASSTETPPLAIDVVAPAVDPDGAIRPPRGPLSPTRDAAEYAQIAAGVLLTLPLAGYFSFWLRAALRARMAKPHAFDRRRALKRLQWSLQKTPLDLDQFYGDLSATTRQFLEATYGIRATVLSSSEILAAMDDISAGYRPSPALADTLVFVDAVRFAGRIPTSRENRELLDRIGVLLGAAPPHLGERLGPR